MALINKVLPGYVATLWMQTGATPTALTPTQLNTWASEVEDIVGTSAGGTALASLLKGMLPTSALGKAALASGVGGVLQGLIGANASNKAAQLQADAAAASRAQQLQMFNTLNQQQAPYRGAGYGALNQIQGMLPGQYTQYDAQGNPLVVQTYGANGEVVKEKYFKIKKAISNKAPASKCRNTYIHH